MEVTLADGNPDQERIYTAPDHINWKRVPQTSPVLCPTKPFSGISGTGAVHH